MFTYSQIARWLPVAVDPITIEDWLANREILGEAGESTETAYLETAYLIEKIRLKEFTGERSELPLEVKLHGFELEGIIEDKHDLVIAPSGATSIPSKVAFEVELGIDNEKPQKISIHGGEVAVIPVLPRNQVKVKIKCQGKLKIENKSQANVTTGGKLNVILDGRGRPMEIYDIPRQQRIMKVLFDRGTEERDES